MTLPGRWASTGDFTHIIPFRLFLALAAPVALAKLIISFSVSPPPPPRSPNTDTSCFIFLECPYTIFLAITEWTDHLQMS